MQINISEIISTDYKVQTFNPEIEMEVFCLDGERYNFIRKSPVELKAQNEGHSVVNLSGHVDTLGKEVGDAVRALSKTVGIPSCSAFQLTCASLTSCTDYVTKEVMSTFGVKKPDAATITALFEQLYQYNN